jgi:hypothetical protein
VLERTQLSGLMSRREIILNLVLNLVVRVLVVVVEAVFVIKF